MYKVTITGKRSDLNEARNFGLGFALCKRNSENEFTTAHTISTCKDYLNDVVYVENLDHKAHINVYGLDYKFTGIFEKQGTGYLFVQPQEHKSQNTDSTHYYDIDFENKNITKQIPFIVDVINSFENKLEFKTKTSWYPTEHTGGFMLHVPAEWLDSPYMVSLYSLLIRGLLYVQLENPLFYVLGGSILDSGQLTAIKTKVDWLLKTKKLPVYPIREVKDYIKRGDAYYLHNSGINKWCLTTLPEHYRTCASTGQVTLKPVLK